MKIVSVVTNNPTFIELQYNSIIKYFTDKNNLEIIVFNDAKSWPDITNFQDTTIKQQISNTCVKLNIQCIEVPNEHHKFMNEPSIRHSNSVNFITKFMISNPDTYLMLDSDMFFIDYFDINEFSNYYFCFVDQFRVLNKIKVNYPWANFFYININNIPNKELIDWSVSDGLDTGGSCALWLSKLDNDKILKIEVLQSNLWNSEQLPNNINKNIKLFLDNDLRNTNNSYFAEIYHNKILHYRAGSNWMNNSYELHNTLTELLSLSLSNM